MALEDRGAACRRVAELYKDDADFCVKVLTNLTSLGDAQFAVLRKEWEKVLDSPAEETFLEEITTLKGWASPHRQASHNKGMKQFWQTLIGLEITAGSFLNLPSNVYLLGRSTWGSSLLVRHCYRGIFDRMMDLRSSNTYRHFLITGTPGIGKSFFAFVLMGWLAKEKKVSKIVFDTQGKRHVLTSKGTDVNVMEGRINMDFDDELEDPRTWWIVDTDIPVERAASTVLLASPDQKRYKEFVNFRGATTLYMPVWTDDEMEKCRKQLFPNLDYALFEELVSKWGNIPRYVLEKATAVWAQNMFDNAVSLIQCKNLIRCIDEPDTAPHASNKLLHMEVVGDQYNEMIMKPASHYVVRKIEQNGGKKHVEQLKNIVELSMHFREYKGTADVFFKSYAHRRLQGGGFLNVRQLRPSETEHLKNTEPFALQRCSGIRVINKLEEVEQQSNDVYYVPQDHNFPSVVDAIMQPNLLFQLTVAQIVQINLDGLQAAADQLLRKPPKLFFAVPDYIFRAFSFVAGVPQEIEQWVLEVPWT